MSKTDSLVWLASNSIMLNKSILQTQTHSVPESLQASREIETKLIMAEINHALPLLQNSKMPILSRQDLNDILYSRLALS